MLARSTTLSIKEWLEFKARVSVAAVAAELG
jgi:hypothetical protein